MYLEQLRLIAYGPFTDCTLSLQPGLNVVYGPNEAGKSSALRAVHALLFGVETRTSDDFVHSYPQLRIGGALVDSQGRRLECVRRKGRKATLRDGDDDKPVDEGELRAMLGGVNEEFFTSVFGIDHQRLREGGEEVIRGEGRVGELLFSAGGVAHLREKQEALDTHAAELFKPRGQNQRINAAVREAGELAAKVRELQRSPEQWARHDAECRRLDEQLAQLSQQLGEAEASERRLVRIRDAKQFVGAWKEKQSQLAAMESVVVLPDDAEQRFQEACDKRARAESAKEAAESRVAEYEASLELLNVPTAFLAEESRIDALYLQLGSHQKAVTDRGVLEGQRRTARDAAKRTLEKLGWDISIDDAKERRIADAAKARVRTLSARHGEVTQDKKRQQQALDRAKAKLAELDKALAAAPNPDEPTLLQNAVASATAGVDIAVGLGQQREEVQRLEQKADAALARLPYWSGALEEACRLKVPGEETIDEFDRTQRDLAAAITSLNEKIEANQTERDEVAQKLEALELQESVPTEQELEEAREIRDRGVRLAVDRLEGNEVDAQAVDAFVSEVAEGADLAEALEPSVRWADEVSDRLRREAKRVADKSQLLARLHRSEAKAEALEAEADALRAKQDDWNQAWTSGWKAAGVDPASPSEMRGWLRSRQELISLSNEWANASAQLERNEQRVEELVRALHAHLEQQGVTVPANADLQQIVEAGDKCLEDITAQRRHREELASDVARLTKEVAQVEQDLKSADQELRQWRTDWATVIEPLGLEADALPEQAEAVLANLDELFRHLDDYKSKGLRIYGIDKTAEEFAASAKTMAEQIASELVELDVEELVTKLNRQLSEAKQVRQQAESLDSQIAAEREIIVDAEQRLTDSTAMLDAMVIEANCGAIEKLRPAIEASRNKKTLQNEVAQREQELTPLCGGRPLSEFIVEVQSEDADRLPTQIEQLAAQIAELETQRDDTITARQKEASELERYDSSAEAAEKAEHRLSILARAEEDVRDYIVTATASRLLQLAVKRYQEKSQGPVLTAASEYFNRLTCQAFLGVRTGFDDSGQEVLVGVRQDGSDLMVDGMSEGTRDQLYLALRLGTRDHWFEQHEPVPFIVDDVLLTFDNDRATAAVRVLAESHANHQVLFFTHHEHLVEIAKTVGADNAKPGVHIVTDWSG